MSGVMKMLDYMLISAIIISEMSLHRSVIGQINRLRRGVNTSKFDHTKKPLKALNVALSTEYKQFSLSDITKVFDFKVISAIILSEMSVHRRVIGQIACNVATIRQSSITRRNLALKVAMSSQYKQFLMWVIMKVFHYKVISAIIMSEMSVHLRVIAKIACDAAS